MKGIYRILNTTSGKEYVGSSKDTDSRWETHRRYLRNGNHPNIILQRNWAKYREAAFVFEVLEEVELVTDLLVREQYHLNTRKPALNIGKHAEGGDNISKHPNREAIRKKISDNTYWKSDKARAASRAKKGELNSNYGNRWTPEQKAKARAWMLKHYETHEGYKTGKTHEELFGTERAAEISSKISARASERTGTKNPFFGKKHSEATREKISETNRGKIPVNIKRVSINGVEYSSQTEASLKLGIPAPTILHRILSKNPKFAGYRYP